MFLQGVQIPRLPLDTSRPRFGAAQSCTISGKRSGSSATPRTRTRHILLAPRPAPRVRTCATLTSARGGQLPSQLGLLPLAH